MSYLVLARKWRPRTFDSLVGQEHVVRALSHALDTGRLHHAWLFTGTRGVGKTTLSRILAKSLNCEQGISAKPCGQCQPCVEIDAGRYVDYLELDAASNRGVDEMTQLLEQAVYAPSAGRFKVYMIDEVHMLSGHAFNAMLKTLEEPPPHVKFILATTDPQKIPVTVLSRCLQFNLKQLPASLIVSYLQQVLNQEGLPFDEAALHLLAQAAAGSMRDALSLTDQAIAFSAENLTLPAVQEMLGTIDQQYLVRLLEALIGADASQVVAIADELATRGLSYKGALADLAIMLSRIAILQRVSNAFDENDPLTPQLTQLAQTVHPDTVQLFYTVAVHSRDELSLAPDEYAGFVMACLRMLALAPQADSGPQSPSEGAAAQAPTLPQAATSKPTSKPESASSKAAQPTSESSAVDAPPTRQDGSQSSTQQDSHKPSSQAPAESKAVA
ncbi:MAG TPA: DNA polymerase III subunit gamma/tau, partial [Burkholderiaceae bacterium]|nr:DNA polymerase III subunit gamma/tau [Burkholderiaceae bacterium]